MRVGVPKEIKDNEFRVALTPHGVAELRAGGHQVLVEKSAGAGSSITDDAYVAAGAEIVDSAASVWASADLLLKVKEPIEPEYQLLRHEQIVFTYLHLAANKPLTEALIESGTTAIAYETVALPDGRLPLLAPMSEIAGRMASQVAAHLLEREQGGRGVLMGGVSGVSPATVVVLGAGVAGRNAARIASGMDAEVIVLDTDINKLRALDETRYGRVTTLASSRHTIEGLVCEADAVIGSVLIPGAKAPRLVTADLLKRMRPGAVLIDIAIDQGGCFETSRMTTHTDPTYVVEDIVHYCVGNMPGAVPHTSTYALTNATLPYVLELAARDARDAIGNDPALALGVNVWNGDLVNEPVAVAHGLSFDRGFRL